MELSERFRCYSFFKKDDNFLTTTCSRIKNRTVQKNLLLSLPEEFRKDANYCG